MEDIIYRSVKWNGSRMYNVGIKADGTLHNPKNYPDDEVREAVNEETEKRAWEAEIEGWKAKAKAEKAEKEAKERAEEPIRRQIRELVRDKRNTIWSRLGSYNHVGLLADGTLYNPHGYPEAEVRAKLTKTIEWNHECASRAAKKAPETRKRRDKLLVTEMANRIRVGHRYGPREYCYRCGKYLTDHESIERGIGPECWQGMLSYMEMDKAEQAERAALRNAVTQN